VTASGIYYEDAVATVEDGTEVSSLVFIFDPHQVPVAISGGTAGSRESTLCTSEC